MDVVILGTGCPIPDPNRAGPATLVRAGGKNYLFDCGRAVLMRAAAIGLRAPQLDALFFTHLHSDHVTDFNDIVTTRWLLSFEVNPLPVYGPIGTQYFADATIAMLKDDIRWRQEHHTDLDVDNGPKLDVHEIEPGYVFEDEGVPIVAAATDHAPVYPTLGFRIEADGKSVAIAGDTLPCKGLDDICAGADVYVQTVLRRDLAEKFEHSRPREALTYHSTVEDAGQTAARCGVANLVLNHGVPPPVPGEEGDWIAQAAQHFDGKIYLADDLFSITA